MLTPHFSFAIKPMSVIARLTSALSHAAAATLPLVWAIRKQQQTGHFRFGHPSSRKGKTERLSSGVPSFLFLFLCLPALSLSGNMEQPFLKLKLWGEGGACLSVFLFLSGTD